MRVHHLNCGTMCPLGGRLFDGETRGFGPAHLVCHCLLLETSEGLVLIDTGLGTKDIVAPEPRLSRFFLNFLRPTLSPAESARRQIDNLGFNPSDVRHIVLTHLDFDHAGGIEDFPQAMVHVLDVEYEAAKRHAGFIGKRRYRPMQWDAGVRWVLHQRGRGEPWYGFEAVQTIPGSQDDILLIPLFGHTHGHCGVAVRTANGYLLHAGDAYFHHDEMDARHPHCVPGLRLYQRMMEVDRKQRLHNQERLRAIRREYGHEIRIISAHDSLEFRNARREEERWAQSA